MICTRYLYKKENINKNQIILDIETTGVDANYDKLVVLGLIYYDNKKKNYYIDQYFAKDDLEEIRLLKIYKNKIKDKCVITYNGEIFDIPFLNIRLIKNNLDTVFPDSIDLYKIIKSKGKLINFDSMKLIDIEKKIGIYRNDPSRYKVISKLKNKNEVRENPWPILIHNKNDLISTEKITNIEKRINNSLSLNINNINFYIDDAYIIKDIATIKIKSNQKLPESLFSGNNYNMEVKDKDIVLKIMVLYGKLSKYDSGFVTLNYFNIKNDSKFSINENLITIMENNLFNSKNILNIFKYVIIKNLDL